MAILQAQIYSDALQRPVPISVILPSDKTDMEGKRCAKPPFKTLYLLHGIFGDHTDWITNTRIVRWAMDHDIAVVMPAGENHFYMNMPGEGSDYGDFIGKELVELTREMFPLSEKREDTYIGGLSMGGGGALLNGLRNPDTFGGIISLSAAIQSKDSIPTSDDSASILGRKSFYKACTGHTAYDFEGSVDDLQVWLEKAAARDDKPRMYVACGTDDFLLPKSHKLKQDLVEHGFEVTYDEQPGGHDWDFWDQQIQKVIAWISPEAEAGISSGNVGADR